jgi:hypothetical protein
LGGGQQVACTVVGCRFNAARRCGLGTVRIMPSGAAGTGGNAAAACASYEPV